MLGGTANLSSDWNGSIHMILKMCWINQFSNLCKFLFCLAILICETLSQELPKVIEDSRGRIVEKGSAHITVVTPEQVSEFDCKFDCQSDSVKASMEGEAFLSAKVDLRKLGGYPIVAIGRFALYRDNTLYRIFEKDRLLFVEVDNSNLNAIFDVLPDRWFINKKFGDIFRFMQDAYSKNPSAFAMRINGDDLTFAMADEKASSLGQSVEYRFALIDGGYAIRHFRLDTGFQKGKEGPIFESEYDWTSIDGRLAPVQISQWFYKHGDRRPQPNSTVKFADFSLESPGDIIDTTVSRPVGTSETRVSNGTSYSVVIGGEQGEIQHALINAAFDVRVQKGLYFR